MSTPFDPDADLIYIWAEILGNTGKARLLLALDIGATNSMISQTRLAELGYVPEGSERQSRIITGSGVECVFHVTLKRLAALGHRKEDFEVHSYDLPPETGIDGVLGLDFFRGQNLNIDFRNGLITLS